MEKASSEDLWAFYNRSFRNSENEDISSEKLLLIKDKEAYKKIY